MGRCFSTDDLPRSDLQHRAYLDYYDDIGIDPTFYWFTLAAAPAEDIHWMTGDEGARFDLATGAAPVLGAEAACDQR